MKRTSRDLEQGNVGRLSAGSGGGGWKDPTASAAAKVQQSMNERGGGFPTRNGKPMMTKMEQRKMERAAQPKPPLPDEAARAARKAKFGIEFKGGGYVKGEQ